MFEFVASLSMAGFIGLLFYAIRLHKRLVAVESGVFTTRASEVDVSRVVKELERLALTVEELDIAINGKEHPNEKQRYGGLIGFGGDAGRVQFIEGRLRQLTTILNEKLVVIGEKIDTPLLGRGYTLDSELDAKQFAKK